MAEHKTEHKGFLKGIIPSAFLDCYQECHAFVEGFCEVMCPWPAKYRPSEQLITDLKGDHHYYVGGRVCGFVALVIFIALIAKWVF